MTSFYSVDELKEIGFKSVGNNVLISRKASIYSPSEISIGNNVRIDDFCILSGNITIENYIHIAAYTALYGDIEGIYIKNFANISSRVAIYAVNDDYNGYSMTNPMISEKYKKMQRGKVVIEEHVIVGSSCTIIPNVALKKGCAIGSMSFVNKSCEEFMIYAGIPIRKIKNRHKDLLNLEKEFLKEFDG